MRRTTRAAVLVTILFGGTLGGDLLDRVPAAHADEGEAPAEMVLSLFHVSALTAGRTTYQGQQVGSLAPGDMVDEDNPLFGSEAEEPVYPLGTIDELIEWIRESVEPRYWHENEAAGLRASGEEILLVKCHRDVADQVAAFLGELERSIGRLVRVEAMALRRPAALLASVAAGARGAALSDAAFAALLAAGEPGPMASLTAFADQQGTTFDGTMRAYLQEYDTEVAEEARAFDPIVSVSSYGLGLTARPMLSPRSPHVLLHLNASLARLRRTRTQEIEAGQFELPDEEAATFTAHVSVPAGRWCLLPGAASDGSEDRWMLLVRATPLPPDAGARVARRVELDTRVEPSRERFALRRFDVSRLAEAVASRLGLEISLVPSNFTPPEPPELPEPEPIFSGETISDLIQRTIAASSWDSVSAMLEVRAGTLVARNRPNVLDAIERFLTALEREVLWTVHFDVAWIEADAAVAAGWLEGDGLLDAATATAIDAALSGGSARRLDQARLSCIGNTRGAVEVGRHVHYLSDFEVEIAKGVHIGNPVVGGTYSGIVVDLAPSLSVAGDAVHVDVRITRSQLADPIRALATPYGELDLPELAVSRVRTSRRMPLGRTAVVASGSDGPRTRILLVTPRLERGP